MTTSQCLPLKMLIVALAATVGGCATSKYSPPPYFTYCVKYPNVPECGGVVPAPVAAAPAAEPAAAAAPAAPQEKTVAVADCGAPPNTAGQCFTKVIVPAQWREEPMQQQVSAAGERTEFTEPVYEEVEEQVMVRPATKRVTVVPAEFEEVEERVLIREAYRREIEVPALYNTYFERVIETPARQVWKPGRGTVEMVDPNTGEILCLVEEEAVYKTVERKELARAATKRYEDVPAEYATVRKTVLKTPETTQEIEEPAVFETIRVTKMVKAPEPRKVPVEAVYTTVNRQVMAGPPSCEWSQVLCDVNTTPEKIQQVERALQSRGFTVNVDGQIDQELTDSVRSFQEQNGLRVTGLMTADTLAALGVDLQ
jgi:murein L,D-transpeptidase YcbB/YkuD